jgi:hypothetical protein
MSDELAAFIGITALAMAAIIIHGETVRRISCRERKDAYEKGYYQGYTDHVLGRSRSRFQPAAEADRDENQTKAPGEHELPEGQIER